MLNGLRRLLLLAVGFTLPIEGLGTFSLAGYPVSLNKATAAVLLLFSVLDRLLSGRRLPWSRKHPWLLVFAFAVGLSAATALVKGAKPGGMLVLLSSYAAVFLFYFLVPHVITSLRDLRVLLVGLAFGAVFSVSAGLFIEPEQVEASGRFLGTTANPNTLANNLIFALPVTVSLLTVAASLIAKLALIGGIAVEVGGVVASLSRSAFVALLAMGVLWILRFGRIRSARYLVIPLLIGVGVSLLAPQAFFERVGTFSETGRRRDSAIQHRILGWEWGARAFLSNPLIGVGLERVGDFAHPHEPRLLPGDKCHNTWLSVAAEMGILGVIPFLMLTFLGWRDYTSVYRTARSPRHAADPELAAIGRHAVFFQLGFFGLVVGSQFGTDERVKGFWLLLGLSTALVTLARARLAALSRSTA